MEPEAVQTFQLRGFSTKSMKITETLICTALIDKFSTAIYETEVSCEFHHPLLEFPRNVIFSWIYDERSSQRTEQVRKHSFQ
jgi:hypothetical protein